MSLKLAYLSGKYLLFYVAREINHTKVRVFRSFQPRKLNHIDFPSVDLKRKRNLIG